MHSRNFCFIFLKFLSEITINYLYKQPHFLVLLNEIKYFSRIKTNNTIKDQKINGLVKDKKSYPKAIKDGQCCKIFANIFKKSYVPVPHATSDLQLCLMKLSTTRSLGMTPKNCTSHLL